MPPSVRKVVDALGDAPGLPGVRDERGGIRRELVVNVLEGRWATAGVTAVPSSAVDGIGRDGVAVRVEAGRAHTNNEGVVAVLEAAIDPRVSYLVLIVPEEYKGSVTAARVVERVERLFTSPGVMLDLQGVAVVAY